MDAITRLARPDILAMQPYSSARKEGEQQHMSALLDANENPYPPYPGDDTCLGMNFYPEPQPSVLLSLFSAHYGVEKNQLLLSRGADEAIDLLIRAFCEARNDAILINSPTFVMYDTAARIQQAQVIELLLRKEDHFQLDVPAILAAYAEHPSLKLLFICSPNNPTGQLMRREDILLLCNKLLGRSLVIVDEAYVEFSGAESLAAEIAHHPNLVILRTLSKEYSLAGERCGVTLAHPQVIAILGRIMAPYPLPVSSIRAIAKAMSPEGVRYARENIQTIIAERIRMAESLHHSPAVLHLYESDTNFLLLRTKEPAQLVANMAKAGIKIRDRSKVKGLEGCVRIGIGAREQNDRVLALLGE